MVGGGGSRSSQGGPMGKVMCPNTSGMTEKVHCTSAWTTNHVLSAADRWVLVWSSLALSGRLWPVLPGSGLLICWPTCPCLVDWLWTALHLTALHLPVFDMVSSWNVLGGGKHILRGAGATPCPSKCTDTSLKTYSGKSKSAKFLNYSKKVQLLIKNT